MVLGGYYTGFYVKTGTTTFNAPGCYVIPENFRCVCVTAAPGNPGNHGNFPCFPCNPNPGPGNPSTFNGHGSNNYTRQSSSLVPRTVLSVVVGTGGSAGQSACKCACFRGNPGTNGLVTVVVK